MPGYRSRLTAIYQNGLSQSIAARNLSHAPFAQTCKTKLPFRSRVVRLRYSRAKKLVRLLLHHHARELGAVTSRLVPGRRWARSSRKFASHPKSRELRFSEPNVELLAQQGAVVFLALRMAWRRSLRVPLLARGCQVMI